MLTQNKRASKGLQAGSPNFVRSSCVQIMRGEHGGSNRLIARNKTTPRGLMRQCGIGAQSKFRSDLRKIRAKSPRFQRGNIPPLQNCMRICVVFGAHVARLPLLTQIVYGLDIVAGNQL